MSNPGIFILFSENSSFPHIKSVQIEDNIGESIHVHINDYRLDLTLNEFENLCNIFSDALMKLDDTDDKLQQSPQFLAEMYKLNDYQKIDYEVEKRKLDELFFIVRKPYLRFFFAVSFKKIIKTPQYLYLKGQDILLDERYQYSALQQNEIVRLNSSLNYIKEHFPNSEKYNIFTFGENNLVRDGVHTSASIAFLHGAGILVNVIKITNKKISRPFYPSLFWTMRVFIITLSLISRRILVVIVGYLRNAFKRLSNLC